MKKILYNNYIINTVAIGLLLIGWQCICLITNEPLVFPSIATMAKTATAMLQTKLLWITYFETILMLATAWIILCMMLIVTICLCWLFPYFRKILECYCGYFTPLPSFVLIPFLILIFGLSNNVVICIVVFSVYFATSYQILFAFDSIKITWEKHIKNLNWGLKQSLIHVYFPATAPIVISLFSTSWAYMWRTLISLEVVFGNIGGYQGLGTYMINVKSTMDIDKMYVIVFIIAINGYIFSKIFESLVKKFKL
jgi:ABC-type nitrate/sulfonate/bicarbonate transport system permease component